MQSCRTSCSALSIGRVLELTPQRGEAGRRGGNAARRVARTDGSWCVRGAFPAVKAITHSAPVFDMFGRNASLPPPHRWSHRDRRQRSNNEHRMA